MTNERLKSILLEKGFTETVTNGIFTYCKECENIELKCAIQAYENPVFRIKFYLLLDFTTRSNEMNISNWNSLENVADGFKSVLEKIPLFAGETDIHKPIKRAINVTFLQ